MWASGSVGLRVSGQDFIELGTLDSPKMKNSSQESLRARNMRWWLGWVPGPLIEAHLAFIELVCGIVQILSLGGGVFFLT